jgi:deoxyribodipyrimidine photolyase
MTAGDDSTKFSPWLANGCISSRQIYHELKKYESQRTSNKSTYWVRARSKGCHPPALSCGTPSAACHAWSSMCACMTDQLLSLRQVQFELTWRDYYKFFTMKHGNGIFLEYGTKGRDVEWRDNPEVSHPAAVTSSHWTVASANAHPWKRVQSEMLADTASLTAHQPYVPCRRSSGGRTAPRGCRWWTPTCGS